MLCGHCVLVLLAAVLMSPIRKYISSSFSVCLTVPQGKRDRRFRKKREKANEMVEKKGVLNLPHNNLST